MSSNVDNCTVIIVQLFVLGVKYGQMTKFHCFYIFLALWAIFWQWVVAAAERMQGKRRLPLTGLKSESTSVKGKAVHVHNRNAHAHASCLINLNDRAVINSDYHACWGWWGVFSFALQKKSKSPYETEAGVHMKSGDWAVFWVLWRCCFLFFF